MFDSWIHRWIRLICKFFILWIFMFASVHVTISTKKEPNEFMVDLFSETLFYIHNAPLRYCVLFVVRCSLFAVRCMKIKKVLSGICAVNAWRICDCVSDFSERKTAKILIIIINGYFIVIYSLTKSCLSP